MRWVRGFLFAVLAAAASVGCLSGCATEREYQVDVDALIRELKMEGVEQPATLPAEPVRLPPSAPVADSPLPVLREAPLPPPAVVEIPEGEITIQPDCLVQITVDEDPELNGTYPVNEIGAVKLGYVGPVILYNKTEVQAAEKIRDILTSRHFRNATVQVRIIRASYDKVRVDGEVMSPGVVKIGAGDSISLNDLLLRAGGLKPTAKGAMAKVVRTGLLSAVALAADGEVYALFDEQARPLVPDVRLRNNDIVMVFVSRGGDASAPVVAAAPRQVLVLGEVNKPGIYTFDAGEPATMLRLMLKMGGQISSYANARAVRVIRQGDGEYEQELRVDVEKLLKDGDPAEDIELMDGDRVIVPQRRVTLF
jgi:protein involved in polysaccharide export with SLBB domain